MQSGRGSASEGLSSADDGTGQVPKRPLQYAYFMASVEEVCVGPHKNMHQHVGQAPRTRSHKAMGVPFLAKLD
eukprot:2326554-Amphidinium_carterae.2